MQTMKILVKENPPKKLPPTPQRVADTKTWFDFGEVFLCDLETKECISQGKQFFAMLDENNIDFYFREYLKDFPEIELFDCFPHDFVLIDPIYVK